MEEMAVPVHANYRWLRFPCPSRLEDLRGQEAGDPEIRQQWDGAFCPDHHYHQS